LPSKSDSEREAGVNNQVLLDKLSEYLMVEQCGWQLYRVVSERATDPELQAPYQEFGQETDRHRTILTGLIRDLGGDPDYVSPTARLAQAKSEALLGSALVSGPLSEAEREANDLENVLLAETKDHADWELLGQLADQLPNGKPRTAIEAAVAEVGPQEDEHLGWAQTKLAELGLKAIMGETPPPDPDRLDQCVIQPELKIKEIHAAPIDKRNLLDGAKLPPAQETPIARTSSGA
jgi:rubrerythrin